MINEHSYVILKQMRNDLAKQINDLVDRDDPSEDEEFGRLNDEYDEVSEAIREL